MAHFQEGLLGEITGRLGNLVIYKMNGEIVVRRMPVRKGGVVSPRLKEAQGHFARVMSVMQAVKPFINRGFEDVSGGRFIFQRALSENLKLFRDAGRPGDLGWLQISMGERAGAKNPAAEIHGNKVRLIWGEAINGKPTAKDDRVMLAAINTISLNTTGHLNLCSRSEGQADLVLPKALPGEPIMVFLTFYDLGATALRKNPMNISDSQVVVI